jgi:hypothetical protein
VFVPTQPTKPFPTPHSVTSSPRSTLGVRLLTRARHPHKQMASALAEAEHFLSSTLPEHNSAVAAARTQRQSVEELVADIKHKQEEDVRVRKSPRKCPFPLPPPTPPLPPSFPPTHPHTRHTQGVKLVAARMIKEREDAILQLKKELARRDGLSAAAQPR